MRLFTLACLFWMTVGSFGSVFAADDAASAAIVRVPKRCLVSLIDEARVPAEDSGVLDVVTVKEGAQVAKDELLAKIDDKLARIQHRAAKAEMEVAAEKIEQNKISREYQVSAYKVAELQYTRRKDAQDKVTGSVTELELLEFWLKADGAKKQIQVSESEEKVAAAEYRVKEVQVEAAAEAIEKRQIKSPIDGVVVQVERHQGEWVQPGDPVFHVVSLSKLRVQGTLPLAHYSRAQINGKPVVIEAELAGGRKERFEGQVVFVNPIVGYGGRFEFWAEVSNKKENNTWLLAPGMEVDMTVRLK